MKPLKCLKSTINLQHLLSLMLPCVKMSSTWIDINRVKTIWALWADQLQEKSLILCLYKHYMLNITGHPWTCMAMCTTLLVPGSSLTRENKTVMSKVTFPPKLEFRQFPVGEYEYVTQPHSNAKAGKTLERIWKVQLFQATSPSQHIGVTARADACENRAALKGMLSFSHRYCKIFMVPMVDAMSCFLLLQHNPI